MINDFLNEMAGRAVALDDEKSFNRVRMVALVLYPVLVAEAVACFCISKIIGR